MAADAKNKPEIFDTDKQLSRPLSFHSQQPGFPCVESDKKDKQNMEQRIDGMLVLKPYVASTLSKYVCERTVCVNVQAFLNAFQREIPRDFSRIHRKWV